MPKANLGPWGHTIRPNGGEWDLLGMESHHGDEPDFVGLHGCVTSPAEKELPQIGFQQFKFKYMNIASNTPESMPYVYAQALVSIAKGEAEDVDRSILAYLYEHGYITNEDNVYKPTFLVMFREKLKPMPSDALAKLEKLRAYATKTAMRHYLFCREQLYTEIPAFLKSDEYQIDHACANIFAMRGAVLEEALRIGYISYSENDDRRMLGTFLRI